MVSVNLDVVCRANNCDNFDCVYEGTDDCSEKCSDCDKSVCKNCTSSKQGTC